MPLSHGKSKKAFQHNIKAEMAAGKNMKQSLAIAYAQKRRAQKKANGGIIYENDMQDDVEGIMGAPERGYTSMKRGTIGDEEAQIKEESTGYQKHPGNDEKYNSLAMREDAKRLNQQMIRAVMGMPEADEVDDIMSRESKDFSGLDRLAYGGMAEGDIVGRVMKKRYSEGGRVANDSDPISEGMPNEFDDLVLRDDLESTYGDDNNSGDASGNAQESKDRADIIAMIMKRRAKQHNPVPA